MNFIYSPPDRGILLFQLDGMAETDVFCIFLGKVWKMKMPSDDDGVRSPNCPNSLDP